MKWTREQAIELCGKIEMIAPSYGAHLTRQVPWRRDNRHQHT